MPYIPIVFGVFILVIVVYSIVKSVNARRGASGSTPSNTASPATLPDGYANMPAEELYSLADALVDEDGYKTDFPLWLTYITASAEKGYAPAQRELGIYHERENNAEALKWLNLACQNGDVKAAVELADIYERGIDRGSPLVQKNIEGALAVIKPYAERGEAEAQYMLAHILNYDKDDEKAAVAWYEKAAAQDHIEALKELAEIYEFDDDWSKPRELFKRAAELGDAEAMHSVGDMYYCDEESDYKSAAEWYEKAAAAGSSFAMCDLGKMYLEGKGVLKDEGAAFELFKKADAAGSLYGKYLYGKCYMEGVGVQTDKDKGIKLYTDSARYDGDAQYALALCYLEGNGVKKNIKTAVTYLEKAAANDLDGNATYKLAEMYYGGEGVKKDEERARGLWRKAATDCDHKDSAECLKLYFGEVVETDD